MKKTAVLLLLLLLTGCSDASDEIEKGMELRSKLLQASECSFSVSITADYSDKLYTFSMDCEGDSSGDMSFSVTEPATISGISGKLTGNGGQLTFDDNLLYFDLMGDNDLSPISAPWILLKTLRSGYLSSACLEGEKIRLSMDDHFADNPLRLDIWLNKEHLPEYADILYDGKRILSVTVANFQFL